MNALSLRSFAKYALLCAPLAIVACDDDDTDVVPVVNDSPSDVLEARDEFEELEELLDATDLLGALDDQTAFTLFAPNNAAVTAASGAIGAMTEDMQRSTLLYHAILGQTVRAADIGEGLTTTTSADNSQPSLVIENDGTNVTVNNAAVLNTDIETDNGVLHEIDAVLTLPTVVDLATYVDDLSSLVAAVTRADLVEALSGDNDEGDGYTVFAPTNAAFEQTPTGDLDDDTLAGILLYHVVPSLAFSGDLMDGMTVPTLRGDTLSIDAADSSPSGFTVTGTNGISRNIVATDIRGTNGVVHTINGVLLFD